MYITGNKFSFENRQHQLPTSTGDLNKFLIEYSGYSGIPQDLKNRFQKEHQKKTIQITLAEDIVKKYI